MQTIRIATDFTPFPGGRYKRNGRGSGEEFRDRFLLPALAADKAVCIDLDGASGYPPSFLEEAFGGLVRAGYDPSAIKRLVKLQASAANETYKRIIWEYVDRAGKSETASH